METKAFDLITAKLEEALAQQEFVRQKVEVKEEKGMVALYTAESIAYSVLYDTEKKRFDLRTCGMEESGPDNKWKSIAVWLFDPQVDTERDAESIANDFVETVQGPQRKAIAKSAKKKKKDEENNVDPLFFMNRLVAFLPGLKEEIRNEKESYETFRGVTFTKEKVLPQLQFQLKQGMTEAQMKKLGNVMSDCYASGDLDVRGIITYVILNSLEGRSAEQLKEYLSDELKVAWKHSLKLKDKKIKPEKKKKPKKIMAETLNGRM